MKVLWDGYKSNAKTPNSVQNQSNKSPKSQLTSSRGDRDDEIGDQRLTIFGSESSDDAGRWILFGLPGERERRGASMGVLRREYKP